MKKTLLIFRAAFMLLSLLGCFLIYYVAGGELPLGPVLAVGILVAFLVILTDLLLEGFSLRGLSAISFGLVVGTLIAYLLSNSPLFEPLADDPDLAPMLFLVRLVLYIVTVYLATVVALRGKDEFNLVIPYVRFNPHNVDTQVAVVDTSALIDGRIVALCESKWIGFVLLIPRFVLDELQGIADSTDSARKAKGRKGLEVLNRLRQLKKRGDSDPRDGCRGCGSSGFQACILMCLHEGAFVYHGLQPSADGWISWCGVAQYCQFG